ncbi:hypothetical protein EXN23_02935 [Agrobacterium salinitolerans]|uniref:Propionyl-coenzyme A carboxylase alpha polypeptide n=1 Tax=Agrobacterium salinitolerans TaxID=1183413 RepID=A0ABY3BVX6_9HYPH|nr:hypothetical protein C2E26_01395 [Rhizobium sp. YIC5082]TRA97195.1 hypothetical protein EXN23_02935 [Agrobacterium salinitolerans]
MFFRRRWGINGTPAPFLIPAPVTGIQPARVCATGRVLSAQGLGLAPCDEHRDEGGKVRRGVLRHWL